MNMSITMPTNRELCNVLADALGIEREVVDETVHHLRETKMLPDGEDTTATVDHAVTLLIALMGAPGPEDAPDSAQLYAQLPLDRVMRCESMSDGRFESIHVPDTDPFVEDLSQFGTTFGTFLAGLVSAFNEAPEVDIEPGEIIVGGGLGTATASINILALADSVNVGGTVKFSLAPMGGDQMPDDAPAARLDRYTIVPGPIFAVFRKFFGSADGPRKVVLSRADMARLSQESSSCLTE